MKRCISRLSICLILGAVTTVAVAWGMISQLPCEDHSNCDSFEGYDPLGDVLVICVSHTQPGVRRTGWFCSPFNDEDRRPISPNPPPKWLERHLKLSNAGWNVVEEMGFPFRSLFVVYHCPDFDVSTDPQVQGGISINVAPDLREIWAPGGWGGALLIAVTAPGFILNTATYALLWLAILLGPSLTRRTIRRRRGRCTVCAYDLRAITSDRCPECGTFINCVTEAEAVR